MTACIFFTVNVPRAKDRSHLIVVYMIYGIMIVFYWPECFSKKYFGSQVSATGILWSTVWEPLPYVSKAWLQGQGLVVIGCFFS